MIRCLYIQDDNINPAILDKTLYDAGFAFYEASIPLDEKTFTTLEDIEAFLENK